MKEQTHLIIDGYKCNHKKLNDITFWYNLLHKKIPELLNMKTVGYPVIYDYKNPNPILEGLTGFQIIATSHISFHSWVKKGELKMDIYSCKNFDFIKVLNFIKKEVDIKLLKHKVIPRGDEI